MSFDALEKSAEKRITGRALTSSRARPAPIALQAAIAVPEYLVDTPTGPEKRSHGANAQAGGAIKAPGMGRESGKSAKSLESRMFACLLAERVGFEPTIGYSPIHAFQACAFNRSAISPAC